MLTDEVNEDVAPDTPAISEISVDDNENPDEKVTQDDSAKTIKQRRGLLNSKLKDYKQEKLKRKLPADSQMLGIAQEELEIKKRLIDKMEEADKENSTQTGRLMTNMDKLTGSIAEGFAILRQVMLRAHHSPTIPIQSSYPPVPPLQESITSNNNRQFSFTQALYSQDDDSF